MRRGVAVLLIAGACWPALASTAGAQQPAAGATIAAVGEGHVSLTPDQATLSVSVLRLRTPSAAARAAANRQVARIRRTLRSRGVPAAAVQPTVVSVSRQRVRRHGQRPRTRYRAFTQLEVRSH